MKSTRVKFLVCAHIWPIKLILILIPVTDNKPNSKQVVHNVVAGSSLNATSGHFGDRLQFMSSHQETGGWVQKYLQIYDLLWYHYSEVIIYYYLSWMADLNMKFKSVHLVQ